MFDKYLNRFTIEQNMPLGADTSIYESNLDKIGQLSIPEINSVSGYYSALNDTEDGMNRVIAAIKYEYEDDYDIASEEDWYFIQSNFQEEVEDLQKATKRLVRHQEAALNKLDRDDEWGDRDEDTADNEDNNGEQTS